MAQIFESILVSFAILAASETVSDDFHFIRSCYLQRGGQSNSLILWFLLMMVVNPEAQKKAQAQIDAVVGGNRLPMIDDRPLLPYVDAILRETLRCCPVVPLGKCSPHAFISWLIYHQSAIPHAVVDDDVYAGFHIPKGG